MDVQLDQAAMRQLANGPEVSAALLITAEEGKSIAEALATAEFANSKDPLAEAAKADHYADDFNVRLGDNPNLTKLSQRVSAILENTSDHSLAVEWGNDHFPEPKHILKRTKDVMEGG